MVGRPTSASTSGGPTWPTAQRIPPRLYDLLAEYSVTVRRANSGDKEAMGTWTPSVEHEVGVHFVRDDEQPVALYQVSQPG